MNETTNRLNRAQVEKRLRLAAECLQELDQGGYGDGSDDDEDGQALQRAIDELNEMLTPFDKDE